MINRLSTTHTYGKCGEFVKTDFLPEQVICDSPSSSGMIKIGGLLMVFGQNYAKVYDNFMSDYASYPSRTVLTLTQE